MIDPDKFYNVNEIKEQKLFPWISSYGAIKRYIEYDVQHDNVLEAQVKPSLAGKSGDRYFIKGVNIIKLIARYEDGSLFFNLPRRHKNDGSIESPEVISGGAGDSDSISGTGPSEEPQSLQEGQGSEPVGDTSVKDDSLQGPGEI